jgi:diacylglycerol kinase family enzyme
MPLGGPTPRRRRLPRPAPRPSLRAPRRVVRRSDTIVAGGGDGTLNELVAALLRPPGSALLAGGGGGGGTTVAQLPLGTANDLASASGISLVRPPSGAVLRQGA